MIRRPRFSFLVFALAGLFCLLLQACSPPAGPGHESTRNIIFLIGDGMGNSITSAARARKGGLTGLLRMDEMPVIGLVRTSSTALVTDSAAAGTALAGGVKTNNKSVAMTPDGKKVQSILEAARNRGMATGIVVTSSLADATPACFGAHAPGRWLKSRIAAGLLASGTDLLLGGGSAHFLPRSREGSLRDEERDLVREAGDAGYAVCRTKEELAEAPDGKILGLFARDDMTTEPPEPTLAGMTVEAIRRLGRNRRGFFLLVEGSLIDSRAHDNLLEETLDQTLKFDEAVGAALDFAKKDGRTLVVVTADHDTGGLSVVDGTVDGAVLKVTWGGDNHTGEAVPLFAFGPGAGLFGGFKDNTEIPRIFARLIGAADFPKISE
ncbi:MAG: alkaline phosphatase [Acidobacteriota bacterium]|jgi:alkaline phosphatase|nr:alkaline phosphatase [Acidobacteriota bacterium]OQB58186.1 MAG: Alkaline phosphatase 4 precursor [Candidatus Aminicenantes bacterium ADurb.Bin147]HNQ81566.1 alkaline phosphatase [Candidatus Aminicenantes bacterium]MDD8010596.1 alkaline phosphatase [Acidobacteriota bacterium]MDD8029820.1 alkaline phosphatase [Acidobacteriota bacterium]